MRKKKGNSRDRNKQGSQVKTSLKIAFTKYQYISSDYIIPNESVENFPSFQKI